MFQRATQMFVQITKTFPRVRETLFITWMYLTEDKVSTPSLCDRDQSEEDHLLTYTYIMEVSEAARRSKPYVLVN